MFDLPGARQGPGFFPQMKIRYLITTRTAKAGTIADVEDGHALALMAHRYAEAVEVPATVTASEPAQSPALETATAQPTLERATVRRVPVSRQPKTTPST
jgi:hypothetical protein